MHQEEIHKKIDKVVMWLRDQVNNAGAKGLAVGISGGIDSAVVACLIKKAFPNNSLGVILPIKSNEKDVDHGVLTAEVCNIEYFSVDLEEEHNGIMKKVTKELTNKELFNNSTKRATDANLRARLRMSTIYTIANNLNYLVVGTDNAAELYTGYYTKYGDGGVDLLPIASLKKHEVYEWAKVLDVPNEIIEKQPSAGLWEGQTDENEMGTTYNYIDAFLAGETIPEKDKAIIERLHKNSAHKRSMPPSPNFNM